MAYTAFAGPIGPPAGNPILNQTIPQVATYNVSSGTVRGQLSAGTVKFPDGTIQATAGGGSSGVVLLGAPGQTTARQNGGLDVQISSSGFLYSQGTPTFAAIGYPGGSCVQTDINGRLSPTGLPCGSGGGFVNPGTMTWTNQFGIFASTLSVSTITLASSIVDPASGNRIFGISGAGGSNFYAANNAGGSLAGTGGGNQGVGYFTLTNLTSGSANTATGASAVQSDTSGSFNTGTGPNSLILVTTGSGNTAYGAESGYSPASGLGLITGSSNTFVGFNAGTSNSAIVNGIAIGANTVVATNNTAVIGGQPGTFNTMNLVVSSVTPNAVIFADGSSWINSSGITAPSVATSSLTLTNAIIDKATGHNIFVYIPAKNSLYAGEMASPPTGTGFSNIAYGPFALQVLTTGGSNIGVGGNALNQTTTGSNNTGVGGRAGAAITVGSGNTLIGKDAGNNASVGTVTTGSSNTFVGYQAASTNAGAVNEIAIGANATVSADNTAVIGGAPGSYNTMNLIVSSVTSALVTATNMGIGTTAPATPLDVQSPSGANLVAFGVTGNKWSNITLDSNSTVLYGAANKGLKFGGNANAGDVVISSYGNVGMGNILSPTELLDVNGNIRIRGTYLKFPDGTTQTTAASGSGGGVTVYPATATATFPFGIYASTIVVSGTATVSALNINGTGWPTFTPSDGNAYHLTGSSATVVVGHIPVFSSTNGAVIDGGTSGGGSFINNTSTLQSGATFYVSSGTIKGPLQIVDGTVGSGNTDPYGLFISKPDSGNSPAYGIYVTHRQNASGQVNYGIYSESFGGGSGASYGVYGRALGSGPSAYGGYFANDSAFTPYGIYAEAGATDFAGFGSTNTAASFETLNSGSKTVNYALKLNAANATAGNHAVQVIAGDMLLGNNTGTNGQVITSGGPGATPTWTTVSGGTLGTTWDGGGSVLTTGTTYWLVVPASGTISRVAVTGTPSGSVTVGVSSSTAFNTGLTSICASACPALTSSTTYYDSTLTGWTKAVAKDSFIYFVLNTAASVTQLNITMEYTKP